MLKEIARNKLENKLELLKNIKIHKYLQLPSSISKLNTSLANVDVTDLSSVSEQRVRANEMLTDSHFGESNEQIVRVNRSYFAPHCVQRIYSNDQYGG